MVNIETSAPKQLETSSLAVFLRDLHNAGERNIGQIKVEIYSDSDRADAWRDPAYIVMTDTRGTQRLFKSIMSDTTTNGRITHGLIEQTVEPQSGEVQTVSSCIAVDDYSENFFYLGNVPKSALLQAVEKPADYMHQSPAAA